MKSWYEIKNKSSDVVDVSLHDEIGLWGVSAAAFINDIRAHKEAKSINLSIHSPGGSLLDGLAMYNALRSHSAKVHAHVEGLAASAASIVLMAGDVITMPEDAFIMIHNPWTFAAGDSDEMRDIADTMDKMKTSIVNIYKNRTGKTTEDIESMMDEETWLNSSEALEHGFADTITDAVNVAAKIGGFNKYFKSMPIESSTVLDGIESMKDFERFMRDATGLSKNKATHLSGHVKRIAQRETEDPKDDFEELSAALMRLKIPESI